MKRIYLKCFLHKNFGDDLLVSIFLNRFKNYNFVSYTKTQYKNRAKDNLKLYDNIILKIVDKIIRLISKEKNTLEKIFINKCGRCIVVGGSMFIENKNAKYNNVYFGKNNYSIIGSNFGPYITNKYFNLIKSLLKKADSVYFRDFSSFDKFRDLKNVKLGNDLAFALDKSKYICNEKKQIFISVINCEEKIKEIKNLQSKYVMELVKIVETMQKKNYKIIISSFCKIENDEKTIDELFTILKNKKLLENVEILRYNGNPDIITQKIAESEFVIGSRFHACILALIFEKKLLPLSYNNKTIDFLKTIQYDGKIFDLRKSVDFSSFDFDDINRFRINDEFYKIIDDEFDDFEKIIDKYANR